MLYQQALIFMCMAYPEQQSKLTPAAGQQQQSQLTQESEQQFAALRFDEETNCSSCSSPTDFDNWLDKHDLDIQYAWEDMQANL